MWRPTTRPTHPDQHSLPRSTQAECGSKMTQVRVKASVNSPEFDEARKKVGRRPRASS